MRKAIRGGRYLGKRSRKLRKRRRRRVMRREHSDYWEILQKTSEIIIN